MVIFLTDQILFLLVKHEYISFLTLSRISRVRQTQQCWHTLLSLEVMKYCSGAFSLQHLQRSLCLHGSIHER